MQVKFVPENTPASQLTAQLTFSSTTINSRIHLHYSSTTRVTKCIYITHPLLGPQNTFTLLIRYSGHKIHLHYSPSTRATKYIYITHPLLGPQNTFTLLIRYSGLKMHLHHSSTTRATKCIYITHPLLGPENYIQCSCTSV